MNKRVLVIGIAAAVVLLVCLAAFPDKIRCGHPGAACATAPDAQGYVHFSYVVKPFGISLLESFTGVDVPFEYSSGEDRVKG
ncbi:hypothetical protein GBP94_22020 [Mycobacterium avium subsp. hominissuis]|uniref:hypothetical protein n=1 Tax=Mycobacterium avium TaxID=1764 RepID=UPI001CC589E4|nr:hypothetical protein [Mycobacterium avium]MBZ4632047.1 hypothetical protein [Mycobacterium avium subsp. hominissuis]